jgi:hypothetical protein
MSKKVDGLEVILGFLAATFAYLNVLHPKEEDYTKLERPPKPYHDIGIRWV